MALPKPLPSQSKLPPKENKQDFFWWLLIVLLTCSGIAANYYFASVAWELRLSGWILLICVIALLVFRTVAGQKLWVFIKESRGELRKIFWPTRQETVRTTAMVAAIVIFVALILWGIDTFLLWIVSLLTVGPKG